MIEEKYWIWLQMCLGQASMVQAILAYYDDAQNIYNQDVEDLRKSGLFTKGQIQRFRTTDISMAEKILSDCREVGCEVITPDKDTYPNSLRKTADRPLVLYLLGHSELLNEKLLIGVIGSRHPSNYGLDVAYIFSKNLAQGGAVVVSGGAQGIDGMAHSATLEVNGKTILVMGCGFGYDYLKTNEPIRRAVAQSGALISEFPPYAPAFNGSFIMRNRITAALCNGILVVEAREKSGTKSTVNKAVKLNKEIFVVTGDVKGTNFLGSHEMCKEGAKVVFSADDILSFYGYEIRNRDSFLFTTMAGAEFEGIDEFPFGVDDKKPKKPRKSPVKKKKKEEPQEQSENKSIEKPEPNLDSFSEEAIKVYKAIKIGKNDLDTISRYTGLTIRSVLISVTELEMGDLIQKGPGVEYYLTD